MTGSLLAGRALSGVIEREYFEIRPELSLAYGYTDIGDLDLDVTAFGMTEDVTASIDRVDYATVRFTPEILLPLQRLSDDATLVVAPSLGFEWADGDRECGGGLRLGLRGTSWDGISGWDISLTADRIGTPPAPGWRPASSNCKVLVAERPCSVCVPTKPSVECEHGSM